MTDHPSPMGALTRRGFLAGGATLALSSLAACDSSSTPAAANGAATIRLVHTTSDSIRSLPITAGQKQGIFAKHGINLVTTAVKTSDIATSALVSGRADLGLVQAAYVVSADAAGADLVMVGTLTDQLDYHIITARNITSLAQLAGHKMGEPGPNNGNTATMKAVMDGSGIGASKLTYVTVGAQSGILAALQTNQVQVGLLVAPFTLQATAAGLHDLGGVDKYLPNNTAAAIAGLSKTLSSRAGDVRNFLAAMVESIKWTSANPTAAIKIMQSDLGLSPQIAKESYEAYAPIYSSDGAVSVSGLKIWIDVAHKYGVVNKAVSPSTVYTDKYLPAG
jgi:NitT/TauT family transport system substrate-binding protein